MQMVGSAGHRAVDRAKIAARVDETLRQALEKRRGAAKQRHFAGEWMLSQWRGRGIFSNIGGTPR